MSRSLHKTPIFGPVTQLHARKLTTSACGTSAGAQVNEIKFPRLVLILIMWRAIEMPYQAPGISPRTAKHCLT